MLHWVTRTCQVFKRQMTAYLNHQQRYATQPYRFSLHFQYLKFHLFQQLCLHSTISHHHSLQHYLFLQPISIHHHSLQHYFLQPHLHFGPLRDIITQATDMVTQCALQAKYSYKSFYYVVLLNGQNTRKKTKRT